MTIKNALNWATKLLKKTSTSPALDAEVLLCYILKRDKAFIYANHDKNLSKLQILKYRNLILKRSRYWPVAYLTGHKEFFGLDFLVTPAVLIPRPETELLVEHALKILKAKSYKLKAAIDVGTGSGNIIISLSVILSEAKNLKYYATDSSRKALKTAKSNAQRHGVSKKIKFIRGNLLSPPLKAISYKLKPILILANLPYLTPRRYSSNPDLKHEPRSTLMGGRDGLKYFRELFEQLKRYCHSERSEESAFRSFGLRPQDDKIIVLLEHDPSQKPALSKLAKSFFPSAHVSFYKDLTKRYRIAQIVL